MGSNFPLIADDALRFEDAEYFKQCQVCSAEGVPQYYADRCIIDDSGEADEDNEVYAVCEPCIKAGRVEHSGEYITDEVLKKHAANPVAAKALLRATPRIPLFLQGDDWAICCGELAEFVGNPTSLDELIELERTAQPWEQSPTSYQRDFANTGPPESFREISIFRCVKCQKRLYVDQFT